MSVAQQQWLLSLSKSTTEKLTNFIAREEAQYCVHSWACKHQRIAIATEESEDPESIRDDDNDVTHIDQLSSQLLIAAVFDGDIYGMISTDKYNNCRHLICLSSGVRIKICHLKYMRKTMILNLGHFHVCPLNLSHIFTWLPEGAVWRTEFRETWFSGCLGPRCLQNLYTWSQMEWQQSSTQELGFSPWSQHL